VAEAGVSIFSFYLGVVKAVQSNKTLKTLCLCAIPPQMTDDEAKDMTSLVKQNYGLESLENISSGERMGDMRAILRLNGAGRGYLKDDGSSIVKGVDVLSGVSDEISIAFSCICWRIRRHFSSEGRSKSCYVRTAGLSPGIERQHGVSTRPQTIIIF
jgi:hypothetical protein